MNLLPHQAQFVDDNPARAILAWEMRVGKTWPAAIWIDRPEQGNRTYIFTPKSNKKDWERMNTRAIVYSKEESKKSAKAISAQKPTAIVVDEGHYYASPLFLKKRSQLATALYTIIKENPDCHILILTATPIRQDAWSLHTLLCYIGVYYDWKWWRDQFFEKKQMPFLRFPAYFPKKDWRVKIRPYLEKHCNIVSLKDVVDVLPPIESTIIKIKQPAYVAPEDEIVTWMHEHRYEQEAKFPSIITIGEGYRKILVVGHYTHQIDTLATVLAKDKPVFVLDGRTKDPDATKRAAQEADDCYFIVQSSMGFGFDGWMFGAIVFASMSHSCLNHTQMLGRMRHQEHLHTVPAYYLIGGRWDKRIYDCIEKGKDFNPHIYLHE